jgi:MerR family redox-sensitive transcriptional activator SoxR
MPLVEIIGLTLDVKAKFKSRRKMPELTITSVACKAGIRPSTLRYYEKIGLLPSARRVGGRRRYDFCTLKQLELIAYAKEAGFSLAQIHALQESASRGSPPDLLWRDLAAGKRRARPNYFQGSGSEKSARDAVAVSLP